MRKIKSKPRQRRRKRMQFGGMSKREMMGLLAIAILLMRIGPLFRPSRKTKV